MARKKKKIVFPFWITVVAALLYLLLRGLPEAEKAPSNPPPRTTETLRPNSESLQISAINDFDEAKRELRKLFSKGRDVYCGCSYDFARKPNVDPSSCGLTSKSDRAKRIEWEHVVPASYYGRQFTAWKKGDPSCRGREKRGRECARKASPTFRQIEGDMYNLLPAVGELNRVRSDKSYGIVPGEAREFGACDFETLGNLSEPKDDVRGDIARIYFYMDARYPEYSIVNDSNIKMFEEWAKDDPLDSMERQRLQKIEAVQGNSFFIGRLAGSKPNDDRT